MTAKASLRIMRRELAFYFASPIAYIVIMVFLIATGWLFFSVFFLNGRADLRDFFALLPLILAFVVPAVTMRLNHRLGLLFADIDDFKRVNDTLGHEAGDEALLQFAQRIGRAVAEAGGDEALLARFGGDEFVILLNHLQKPTDAAVVAQKIIDTIRRPYNVKGVDPGTKINIGVSIGIALIPQNGLDAVQLIKHADMAMYKAKERGNRYMYFTPELNKQASERIFLENGIRKALDQKVFDLHYQPIVGGRGTIEGAEALLRWHDRKRGYISPIDFIPVAEETGLILPLGDWVFETACRQLKSWNSGGFDDFYVSINLSVKQFSQEHIVDKLSRIIERTGVEPKNLKIEITESSIMPEPGAARKKMEELKKRYPGIRIAIDDFGTGYSSLSYLSDFPVDILKIDQSFVINMYKKGTTKIINTIITLGNSLLMDVIAEGVETKNQLEYLLSKNCKSFQGFYFGKPVSATALTEMLKTYKRPLFQV